LTAELQEQRLSCFTQARLYLVTDENLPFGELLDRLRIALAAGAQVVQFRAKGLSRGVFLERARVVQELCREHRALFIVNDYADVTVLLGADGLHLGQDDLPPPPARDIVGPAAIIGLSISTLSEARAAADEGIVDYLGVGATFPTDTKPDAEYGGLELLRTVRAELDLPLVAIGGITPERAPEVWAAGADLLAVVSAVFGAPDTAAAVGQLLASAPFSFGRRLG
jgi:thiamine-phosphate pyrophosphorylase